MALTHARSCADLSRARACALSGSGFGVVHHFPVLVATLRAAELAEPSWPAQNSARSVLLQRTRSWPAATDATACPEAPTRGAAGVSIFVEQPPAECAAGGRATLDRRGDAGGRGRFARTASLVLALGRAGAQAGRGLGSVVSCAWRCLGSVVSRTRFGM